jgi:fructosamine-3-kinase
VTLPAGLGEVRDARRVAGGDINDAWAVELADGRRAFVKTRPDAPAGEYAAEAAGLAWLAEADDAVRVPRVLAQDEAFLALEWIEPGRLDADGEEALGRGLAALHRAGADAFGAPWSLHLGAVVLPNDASDDWPAFYAEQRLRPLAAMARDRGSLSAAGARAVESICDRMIDLAGPPEPPARVHGDLWSGNVLAGADGRPWLIDPAAHGAHREIDLALLQLFGSPSPRTLAAYDEVWPRADGHAVRVGLYQLLPLLVHAVLFGGSYGTRVGETARGYG